MEKVSEKNKTVWKADWRWTKCAVFFDANSNGEYCLKCIEKLEISLENKIIQNICRQLQTFSVRKIKIYL